MPKNEMTDTDKLNILFEDWLKEYPIYQGKFSYDGIIDEYTFNQQKIKILFIAKEPNDPDQNGFDFRKWWSEEVKFTFALRICDWAFGILNGFPTINTLPNDNLERVNILKSIAFMNLKKIGGGSSANKDLIRKVTSQERYLISKEISIIKPDIIIGGLGDSKLWDLFFPKINFLDSGFAIGVAKYDSMKIIDYYHPSYRVPRAMSYALLGRVFESEIFQKL